MAFTVKVALPCPGIAVQETSPEARRGRVFPRASGPVFVEGGFVYWRPSAPPPAVSVLVDASHLPIAVKPSAFAPPAILVAASASNVA